MKAWKQKTIGAFANNIFGFGVICTLFIFGNGHPESIKAREFILVDDKGNAAARLGFEKEGSVLWFYDGEGNKQVAIGHYAKGNGLTVFDGSGGKKIEIGVIEDASSGVKIFGKEGKERIGIAHNSLTDSAGLGIGNGEGEIAVVLGTKENGRSELSFQGQDGNPLAVLGANPKGARGLVLNDNKKETIAEVVVDKANSSRVCLYRKSGENGIRLETMDGNTPLIGLFDENSFARILATISGKKVPILSLSDEKNQQKITALVEGGSGEIVFFGKDEKVIQQLPENKE